MLLLLPHLAFAAETVLITEPKLLSDLEKRGLSLQARLGTEAPNNAHLAAHVGYKYIVDTVVSDLQSMKQSDSALGVGMAYTHRLFDARWLTSADARFELAAIVPRLDRQSFQHRTCGELRTIYRLAYSQTKDGKLIRSKLPLTLNVVNFLFPDEGGGCGEIARRWSGASSSADELVSARGPLAPIYLSFERIKSIEINLQAIRWPSTIRPDFGNHAEYLLRVFVFPTKDPRAPASGMLENTPDVPRLLANPALKNELRDWIISRHRTFDEGHEVLPEKFLATKAVSVAPRGSERISNHPFSQLFTPADFSTVTYDTHSFTKTPAAFLRRLNDLSCSGCHQHRSIAGFHLLGDEQPAAFAANSLAVPGSPHLLFDLERRRAFLRAVASGSTPLDARPFSERSDHETGRYGTRCGLGDPSFAAWNCETPLVCTNTGDSLVGECLPPTLGKSGDPCEPSSVVSSPNSQSDRTEGKRSLNCEGFCETTRVGFPRGMCSNRCEARTDNAICGGIALLLPFNACLAQEKAFEDCLSQNVRPAELRSCDEQNPCRDDYVCTRTGSGRGGCIPPYFLFQLRVDGHTTGRESITGRLRDRIDRVFR